ncbi:MAG TPA: polyphosphate kinase 1, partial [Acidimicrobiales bacterium]|nr:polyphosphate kinase 1 [Acidimicrobiales bacterium]
NSVFITDYPDLDEAGKARLSQVFDDKIFPVLTPLAVDPGHPFPYISDLSLNLAVTVTDTSTGLHRFSRVKVPPLLPRYMRVEDTPKRQVLVPIEQVIAENLACLFPGMQIGSHHSFRVTRNADLALEEDDADDLLSAVEMELRRRRFGRAVRLEIDSAATSDIRELLLSELELDSSDVYEVDVPVDLGGLWSIIDLKRPELKLPTWTPVVPTPLATSEGEPADIFRAIRERDILVHHPYESFSASVEKFIEVACGDPDVLAIKQTLYRTSGDSPIVKSLIKAAESGKQVAVLVELKARFDEQRNIDWAKQLEKAGVHVVYGLVGLKTHAKTALIIRSEDDGIRRYCHIGTGNYNPSTARIYEDIGLFSASNDLGADLSELFNFLTGYSRRHVYRKIVVAPTSLHDRIIRLIGDQAALGTEGRVVIKVNGLTHPDIIDALYGASQAGVPIDLIVRGICMLRPGVPGLSETIRVRSIVGRFLEHSRIYSFGSQDSLDSTVLIGSADLMERNLDHRVEAVVPVEDVGLRKRLIEILKLNLEDDTSSWELGSNGEWVRVTNCTDTSLQDSLMLRAISEDRQRRLSGQLSPTVR